MAIQLLHYNGDAAICLREDTTIGAPTIDTVGGMTLLAEDQQQLTHMRRAAPIH